MSNKWSIDGDTFKVLVNSEGQYSIWPSGKEIPKGWTQFGEEGTKDECLKLVDTEWQDMRPNSLKTSKAAANQ